MRCPSCEKFVPYDTEVDPEVTSDPEVSGNTVQMEVRRVLSCGECGEELKEANLSMEADITTDEPCKEGEEHEWDVEGSPDVSNTERSEMHDRHGRPIKSARYRRTYYGAEATVDVKCTKCDHTVQVQLQGEEQASGMDELV